MVARSTSSAFVTLLLPFIAGVVGLSQHESHLHRNDNRQSTSSRRDVLLICIASSSIQASAASPLLSETIDLAAFNTARNSVVGDGATLSKSTGGSRSDNDPSPFLSIRGGRGGKSTLRIPRVGYSLYKTKPEEVTRCIQLALRCGIRHFDTATSYGCLDEARVAFERYLNGSLSKQDYADEKPEFLQLLDDTHTAAQVHAIQIMGYRSNSPNIDGSAGRRVRSCSYLISCRTMSNLQTSSR